MRLDGPTSAGRQATYDHVGQGVEFMGGGLAIAVPEDASARGVVVGGGC